jgi:hypothetical protein
LASAGLKVCDTYRASGPAAVGGGLATVLGGGVHVGDVDAGVRGRAAVRVEEAAGDDAGRGDDAVGDRGAVRGHPIAPGLDGVAGRVEVDGDHRVGDGIAAGVADDTGEAAGRVRGSEGRGGGGGCGGDSGQGGRKNRTAEDA